MVTERGILTRVVNKMLDWAKIKIRVISHKVTWMMGTSFPHAVPLVFVVGYPKSGTTWVSQLISTCLHLPYHRNTIKPVLRAAVVHGHELVWKTYPRGIYVVRDGRDALVSFYYHLSQAIPEGENVKLSASQQKIFPGLKNKADIQENIAGFIEQQMIRPHSSPAHWGNHVQSFFNNPNTNIHLVRYEDLLTDGEQVLSDVVSALSGNEPQKKEIEYALNLFSFERQVTDKKDGEDKSFLRKGIAGDWRNHFTREAAEIFDHYCGDVLVEMGYEQDHSWVKSIK